MLYFSLHHPPRPRRGLPGTCRASKPQNRRGIVRVVFYRIRIVPLEPPQPVHSGRLLCTLFYVSNSVRPAMPGYHGRSPRRCTACGHVGRRRPEVDTLVHWYCVRFHIFLHRGDHRSDPGVTAHLSSRHREQHDMANEQSLLELPSQEMREL